MESPKPGSSRSLSTCPSTPRSLRGSASPLRSPEKGQQPYPVPSQASAWPEPCPRRHAASRRHVASGAAAEALPRHEFDVKHLDMKTYSHGYFRGLVGCRRRRCLGTPGISPPRTGYPRATRQQPRWHCGIPVSQVGAGRCLPSCPRAARKRKGSVSGAGLGPPLGQDREPAAPVVPRGPGSSPPPSAQPGTGPWGSEVPMLLPSPFSYRWRE